MIILFAFLLLLSFFFISNLIIKSIFFFILILFLILLLYYLIFFLYLFSKKKSIRSNFQIPEEIYNSLITFEYRISRIFFFTQMKIVLISDKCEIFFSYDIKKGIFKALPFYRGKHKIKKYHILFTDPLRFLTIRQDLSRKDFYNYYRFGSQGVNQGILPLTSNDIRKFRSMDESIMIRDYLFGDDVRKILWRVYAICDDIKVLTNWLEKTSYNFLSIYISGLYSEDYFFSNLIIYKIYHLIKILLQNNFNLSINGINFNDKDDRSIQKEIFKIYEKEKEGGFTFDYPQSSILLFTALSVKGNPAKELWIPKNKYIYYLTLKDFFTVDKKTYYNSSRFVSLFVKKPELTRIAKFYFSNYCDLDILYEKRYQIV